MNAWVAAHARRWRRAGNRAGCGSWRCAGSPNGCCRGGRDTRRPELTRLTPPRLDDQGRSTRSPTTSCGRCSPRARARDCGTSATRRLVRLMTETGARAGEVLALSVGRRGPGGGHRGHRQGQGREGPPRPVRRQDRSRRSTVTCGRAGGHRLAAGPCCGSARAARSSATTRCATRCAYRAGEGRGSTDRTRTCCGIPPRTAGWPQAALRAA